MKISFLFLRKHRSSYQNTKRGVEVPNIYSSDSEPSSLTFSNHKLHKMKPKARVESVFILLGQDVPNPWRIMQVTPGQFTTVYTSVENLNVLKREMSLPVSNVTNPDLTFFRRTNERRVSGYLLVPERENQGFGPKGQVTSLLQSTCTMRRGGISLRWGFDFGPYLVDGWQGGGIYGGTKGLVKP